MYSIVAQGLLQASLIMGGLVSILSNVFNNHPALMIGTITLTEMKLDPITLKTIYLANIIGSDIGSLLFPIGTLASLIWMHILRQKKIKIKWKDYLHVTLIVVPLTTIVTLFLLYYWVQLIFLNTGAKKSRSCTMRHPYVTEELQPFIQQHERLKFVFLAQFIFLGSSLSEYGLSVQIYFHHLERQAQT